MTLLTKASVVAQQLQTKLIANKVSLGLQAVYYGDQERLATTPVVCVEPSTKVNDLVYATRRVNQNITIYLLVYLSKVQSPQANAAGVDTLVESLEDFIHLDPYLKDGSGNNQLIHSHISLVEFGYSNKANAIYKSSRLTFIGLTQNQLPTS